MDFGDQPKETEFNSSIATLRRIDDLMRQLHDLSRGIIPTNKFGIPLITGNPYELYISTTERLYLEGKKKFKEGEQEEADKLRNKVQEIREHYGTNLHLQKISKGMPPHEYTNLEYYKGWNEMLQANKEYETFIVGCLDAHGMLLINKDTRLAAARVG